MRRTFRAGKLGGSGVGELDGGNMGRVAGDDGELGCAQLGGRDGGEPVLLLHRPRGSGRCSAALVLAPRRWFVDAGMPR